MYPEKVFHIVYTYITMNSLPLLLLSFLSLLQEKIVLLAPSKSPKQTFYTSPLTSSPKLPTRNPHFDFGSSSVHQHYSPILRHASKTTPLGGSPGTHHRQRGLYAKENQDSTVIWMKLHYLLCVYQTDSYEVIHFSDSCCSSYYEICTTVELHSYLSHKDLFSSM